MIATSFAAGIPVVVTPTGGLVEQVQHGVNGLVCDKQTAESIANSIEMIVNNTALVSTVQKEHLERRERICLGHPSLVRWLQFAQSFSRKPDPLLFRNRLIQCEAQYR